MAHPSFIGSIKYQGRLVEDGYLDLQAASRALIGMDEAIRYFLAAENPAIGSIEIPIPVRIRKGSWEALIPSTIGGWIVTAAGLGASAYVTAAAKKIAENDFKDASIKAAVRRALEGVQHLIRLGKHLGHLELRRVRGIRWGEASAEIPNANGDYLVVPRDQVKRLAMAPIGLLSKLAAVVEVERALVVKVGFGGASTEVRITSSERYIFAEDDEESDEVLFPELTHGQEVELEGIVTRENGRTKTLGFLHKQHVLTCMPASNNLLPYKKHLFLFCRMKGTVTRLSPAGQPTEKRPKIVFSDLEVLSEREQLDLGLDDAS